MAAQRTTHATAPLPRYSSRRRRRPGVTLAEAAAPVRGVEGHYGGGVRGGEKGWPCAVPRARSANLGDRLISISVHLLPRPPGAGRHRARRRRQRAPGTTMPPVQPGATAGLLARSFGLVSRSSVARSRTSGQSSVTVVGSKKAAHMASFVSFLVLSRCFGLRRHDLLSWPCP